nr:MAK10-like protein [Tanacetum cinerariifolium]
EMKIPFVLLEITKNLATRAIGTPLSLPKGTIRRTINQLVDGKLCDRNAEESLALLEDLALYDNECWNDPRDFTKPVKAISLPQDVLSTSDRRFIDQVQYLMEVHLAPKKPIKVNKMTSSSDFCSGPHDTQYCMENLKKAFIEYASSCIHEAGGNFTYVVDFMIVEDICSIIDPRLSQVVIGKPFVKISNMTHDPPEGVVRFTNGTNEIAYKMPHKIEQYNWLADLEREHTKLVYLRNKEEERRRVKYVMSKILGFYKECCEIGPIYVNEIADKGETRIQQRRYNVSAPGLHKKMRTFKNQIRRKIDDPNITTEEYIRLEEEKACRRGKGDNDKVNIPSFTSPEPEAGYSNDLDYFKGFENEFPAIVYNDALKSKLDSLTEPTISPQHIDEFNLKDETSLSEYDDEEQNILYLNNLFPFNVTYMDDQKSDTDNDNDEIVIEQSLMDMSVVPLPM